MLVWRSSTAGIRALTRENDIVADRTVACVILAAGAGSRFCDQGHKLNATLPPVADRPAESVASRAIARAVASDIGDVIVVTGRLRADELGIVADDGLSTIDNARWADGQMTSVHVGIEAARASGASIVVVGLADQPGISPDAWRAVAAAALDGAAIAVATYDGQRANPVALRCEVWDLLATDGDDGARSLMRSREDLVVPVSCPGSPIDIDTVEDLHTWQNS
jgi:molybdenum cofactor cytidylyltransferase